MVFKISLVTSKMTKNIIINIIIITLVIFY